MAKRLVEWSQNNCHNVCGLFVLKPGANEVDEEKIEEALKNPIVQWYVENGQIKISRGQAPETLSRLKPFDALALVRRTVDRDIIVRWREAEKRKQVLDALDAQLDAITPKPSSSSSSDADAIAEA